MPNRYITGPAFQRGGSVILWSFKLGTGDAYWGYSDDESALVAIPQAGDDTYLVRIQT
ncbi:hypothetical protein [Actinopolymorpha pittospori]|uniref:Uncharacterized protein n=1 Tax=Actinopolymorpha pittospori TaxID=648752 RepID=A0A927MX73_9ACTN|nr:hypothetical protein [Actinopolymorpha pittospori]MBE1608126.1 hypothetical protein [Actinopolymorpha pittospori]